MQISITEPILIEIGKLCDKWGIEAYLVGGYVRDHYLGRERTDFDITVVGDSIEFAKKLSKHFNTKVVIYEKFLTALVPIGGHKIEIVGTRKEVYKSDSRKPIVEIGTLYDDLVRRDFKSNALAASINEKNFGEVIDEFKGFVDIQNRILTTPLDPIVTFSEDPLRMMRAARFAAQLDFAIDPAAYDAIISMADRIKIISQERITDEFLKILASPKPSIGLGILFETGLMKHFFPEVHNLAGVDIVEKGSKVFQHKDVFWHTLKVVDNIAIMTDYVWLRFAALMHDIAKPATKKYIDGIGWTFYGHEEIGARWIKKIFYRMKFPLDNVDFVETMVRLHQRPMVLVEEEVSDAAIRRLVVQSKGHVKELFTLCRADITTKNPNLTKKYYNNYDVVLQKILDVEERDKLREFQSPVRGEEIIAICQLPPSKVIGFIKYQIEEAILEGIIPNEYEQAKVYFLENKDAWIKDFNENGIKFSRRG